MAVITGAASGIGAATCRRIAAAGATCVAADLVGAADLAEDIGCRHRHVDVSDADEVEALLATSAAELGRIDILVNNAGVLGPGAGLAASDLGEARGMLEVNLMGVAHGMRAAAATMEPGSAIVNTASMAGVVGFAGLGWYGAAKFGVVGLTKHAAVELGPRGIRVNCVCPTGVATAGFAPPEELDHWAVRSQSLMNQHVDRLATPEEVAAAIHYLASDEAAMVNGHALYVDGGLAAGPSVQLIETALGESIRDDRGIIE